MKTRSWLSTHWYSISLALCAGTFLIFLALVFVNTNSDKSDDCRKVIGTFKENTNRAARSLPVGIQNQMQAKNIRLRVILTYSWLGDETEKDGNEFQNLKLKTSQSKQIQKNIVSQTQVAANKYREAVKTLESLPEEADLQTIKIALERIDSITPISLKEVQDYCPIEMKQLEIEMKRSIEMKQSGLGQSQNPTPATSPQ